MLTARRPWLRIVFLPQAIEVQERKSLPLPDPHSGCDSILGGKSRPLNRALARKLALPTLTARRRRRQRRRHGSRRAGRQDVPSPSYSLNSHVARGAAWKPTLLARKSPTAPTPCQPRLKPPTRAPSMGGKTQRQSNYRKASLSRTKEGEAFTVILVNQQIHGSNARGLFNHLPVSLAQFGAGLAYTLASRPAQTNSFDSEQNPRVKRSYRLFPVSKK